jgi:hypothetical protein
VNSAIERGLDVSTGITERLWEPVRAASSRFVSSPFCSSRQASTTSAPRVASWAAISLPMPDVEPVTTTRLPFIPEAVPRSAGVRQSRFVPGGDFDGPLRRH